MMRLRVILFALLSLLAFCEARAQGTLPIVLQQQLACGADADR